MIPLWRVVFLGSVTGSPRVEDSDMPFFVPNISVEFVSAFKQFSLRKEQYHINRFLSIPKRTKSPFLETENYLLFSLLCVKVPMPVHRFKSSD